MIDTVWKSVSRRLVGSVGAGLVAVAFVMVPGVPAQAHARLLSSTPGAGATLGEPVSQVTLTFSDPLKEQFTTVLVTGPDGSALADGGPKVVDRTVVQPVLAAKAGTVRVAWRVVSADGHPVDGSFSFAAPGGSDADPTAGAGAAVSSPTPSTTPVAARETTGPAPWVWLLGGGAVLLVAGAAVFFFRRPRRP